MVIGTPDQDFYFIKKQRRQRVSFICLIKMNYLCHHLHKAVGASDSSACDRLLRPQHKKETVQQQHVVMFHHLLTCSYFLPSFCTGFM